MTERHVEKTCADCKCRNCNPITAMAERLDAWKSAESLLFGRQWGEGDEVIHVAPQEVAMLATWLLYGPGDEDD
jgi:hypothetical protein